MVVVTTYVRVSGSPVRLGTQISADYPQMRLRRSPPNSGGLFADEIRVVHPQIFVAMVVTYVWMLERAFARRTRIPTDVNGCPRIRSAGGRRGYGGRENQTYCI